MNESSYNKISKKALRISFFRLHPEPKFEKNLIDEFREVFQNDFVTFKILGRYDLACIYPTNLDHPILFRKSLKGIRSFSSIECICWEGVTAIDFIKEIKNRKLLSIAIAATKEEYLVQNGGIHNNQISSLVKGRGIHLTSLSWGEQVLLLWADSMSELYQDTTQLLDGLRDSSNDLYHHFALNMDFIQEVDNNPELWNEAIEDQFSIFWKIDLLCQKDVLNRFHEKIAESEKDSKFNFQFYTKKKSPSSLNLSYNVQGGTWGNLIKGIRDIRKKSYSIIASTRLNIFQNDENNSDN